MRATSDANAAEDAGAQRAAAASTSAPPVATLAHAPGAHADANADASSSAVDTQHALSSEPRQSAQSASQAPPSAYSQNDAVSPTGQGRRASMESRSATFSGSATIGISSAMLWRNKSVSCEGVRSFEAARKSQIDAFQEKDRAYWQHFEKEILRAKEENARLQRFFAMRLQADLAYAESLRRIRQVIEKPAVSGLPGSASSTSGGAGSSGAGNGSPDQFSLLSSCAKALNTLGEVQQHQSEKIAQFANVIRRDVVVRPLEEMVTTYDERSAAMLAEGNKLDFMLYEAQKSVVDAFSKYDAIFRDMESDRSTNVRGDGAKQDLWLAEIAYTINVQKLRQKRVEYVKGMSALFQQYKTLEVLRVSVVQTALDTYIRKQKLLYDELSGGMSEPMSAVQRIEPERDLLHSVRRIPKNYTAASLTSEDTEQKLFASLRSPISSPLLVRCGFLKHQVSGSLFRSWKDVLCAITQDEFLHLIELKENSNRSISQSSDAMLEAICMNEQSHDVVCSSICLTNCKIEILGKSAVPSFEITEMTQATGLFSSMFRIESTRKFTFQCSSQSDLIDWVVAAKRFISTGASHSANRPSY